MNTEVGHQGQDLGAADVDSSLRTVGPLCCGIWKEDAAPPQREGWKWTKAPMQCTEVLASSTLEGCPRMAWGSLECVRWRWEWLRKSETSVILGHLWSHLQGSHSCVVHWSAQGPLPPLTVCDSLSKSRFSFQFSKQRHQSWAPHLSLEQSKSSRFEKKVHSFDYIFAS